MNKDNLRGKKISELINEKTKIYNIDVDDGYFNEMMNEVIDYYDIIEKGKFKVFADYGRIVLFKNDEPIIMFPVYEIETIKINEKHDVLVVTGHEELIHYWIEDDEFEHIFTR